MQGRLGIAGLPDCAGVGMRRGTTLLTELTSSTHRTLPGLRRVSAMPSHRKSGALGGYQSLITAISGLTVRFYWDYISSAKTPSPQRLTGARRCGPFFRIARR